jgi:hypothetical protein
MRRPHSFLFLFKIILLGTVLTHIAGAQPSVLFVKKSTGRTYHISQSSELTLEGKTNVSLFTCDCMDVFQPQYFSLEVQDDGGLVTKFNQTKLSLAVKNLDCGNKMMNKDLQKALNAGDHPYIVIELLEIKQTKCNRVLELNDWVQVKSLIRLTLNGRSNEYWLNITAKKIGGNRFRFIGNKTFNMSEFGVTPPTAMMGVVKVKDEIKINLDLEITVD